MTQTYFNLSASDSEDIGYRLNEAKKRDSRVRTITMDAQKIRDC